MTAFVLTIVLFIIFAKESYQKKYKTSVIQKKINSINFKMANPTPTKYPPPLQINSEQNASNHQLDYLSSIPSSD